MNGETRVRRRTGSRDDDAALHCHVDDCGVASHLHLSRGGLEVLLRKGEIDFVVVREGKIAAIYMFFDPLPSATSDAAAAR